MHLSCRPSLRPGVHILLCTLRPTHQHSLRLTYTLQGPQGNMSKFKRKAGLLSSVHPTHVLHILLLSPTIHLSIFHQTDYSSDHSRYQSNPNILPKFKDLCHSPICSTFIADGVIVFPLNQSFSCGSKMGNVSSKTIVRAKI